MLPIALIILLAFLKEKIGISPVYYISALRLQKAKDLLLNTNLRVRDIGLEIGQKSLGTFTTRFTERVGMSPSEFRNSVQTAENHFRSIQKLNDWSDSPILMNQQDNHNRYHKCDRSF